MRRTRFANSHIALPVAGWLLAAMLLSGCASVTPGEVATGVASFVIVQAAEANAEEKCLNEGRAVYWCKQEFRRDLKKGQALYKEQKEAEGGHHPKEMSEELEDYVDEMRSERQEVK